MKILIDESLPIGLKHELSEYHVSTVLAEGWTGKKNGELLRLAETKFNFFITADQNLQYQINLRKTQITVIILSAKTCRLEDLKPLIPKLNDAIKHSKTNIIIIK